VRAIRGGSFRVGEEGSCSEIPKFSRRGKEKGRGFRWTRKSRAERELLPNIGKIRVKTEKKGNQLGAVGGAVEKERRTSADRKTKYEIS